MHLTFYFSFLLKSVNIVLAKLGAICANVRNSTRLKFNILAFSVIRQTTWSL